METNSADNVIVGNFTPPAPDEQQIIIDELVKIQASGTDLDFFEFAMSVGITADMKRVRDFCVNSGMCDKREWTSAVKACLVVDELGSYPKTAVQLVDIFVKRENIHVDYQKRMKRTVAPVIEGTVVTAELRSDRIVDALCRVQESREINTETLKRDLRIARSNLGLKFHDTEIADAVGVWFDEATERRKTEVLVNIIIEKGFRQKSMRDAWEAVCSQFDTTEHSAEFVEAVLSKFIWQVKRKLQNLPITNHLMPVLLGPQGAGKSTFVTEYLLKPVEELVGHTDFRSLEDDRNLEQWRNFVLFLDEMGYAGKADVDKVKNRITNTMVSGRPMRTNDSIQVRQNATFIGCSNKELDQLIRDETGNRRFAALRFAAKPDWNLMNGIDMFLIWKSVDERGPDPIIAVMDQLKERQEASRERSDVELWLEAHVVNHTLAGKKQETGVLYTAFKAWAEEFTPGRTWDAKTWGKEFNRLIKSGTVSGWASAGRSNGKTYYVWS